MICSNGREGRLSTRSRACLLRAEGQLIRYAKSPRTLSFIGGTPTAVDVEPAPHSVLPEDVLSLTDVLPSILHLHFVEL